MDVRSREGSNDQYRQKWTRESGGKLLPLLCGCVLRPSVKDADDGHISWSAGWVTPSQKQTAKCSSRRQVHREHLTTAADSMTSSEEV